MAVYEPHGVHELLFMADQHQMIGAMIGRHDKRCCQADISRFYDQMLRLVRTRTGYRRFHRPARRVPHVDLRYNLARLKLNVCHLQDRPEILLAAKTYGSVFYDKWSRSIAWGSGIGITRRWH
jgi:hypothetical protein